jgi:hypothetical protein
MLYFIKNKLNAVYRLLIKWKNLFVKYNPVHSYLRYRKLKKQVIYIHIGMPKTGSSAIQAFLALNQKFLVDNDFCYPNHEGFQQAFQTSSGNVAEMYNWIKSGNAQALEDILLAASHKNIVLSSEILFVALKAHPEKFADYFNTKNIKIICYIREFSDLIESCVNQHVKNHYLVNYNNIDNIVNSVDYFQGLLGAIKCIPAEKFIIRRYGKNYFSKGTIYHDFLETLGLSMPEEINYPQKNVNPSLNRDALEFKILFNYPQFGVDDIKLKYQFNGVLLKYSVENPQSEKQTLISTHKNQEIKARVLAKESLFKSTFFPKLKEPMFIDQPIQDYSSYQQLSQNKIENILVFINNNDRILFKTLTQFVTEHMSDNAVIIAAVESINNLTFDD